MELVKKGKGARNPRCKSSRGGTTRDSECSESIPNGKKGGEKVSWVVAEKSRRLRCSEGSRIKRRDIEILKDKVGEKVEHV